jgi:hypothetical protein
MDKKGLFLGHLYNAVAATGIAAVLAMGMAAAPVFAETKIGIKGAVEWDTLRIRADVSLDLASAEVKLPSGRSRGEALVNSEYVRLMCPAIMRLQVDSSSTIADLVRRGEFSLIEAETLALQARSVHPALSPDCQSMTASYTLDIAGVSAALLRHNRPAPVMRTLNPVSSPVYSGLIIIASEKLPVYGMTGTALPVPCLFPKVWDADMNLIFERDMLEVKNKSMVLYSPPSSIFQNNPSGLSEELKALVGDHPLRVFARGVFGISPTDLIIDREDALVIISQEANRRLLSEGKVAVILDESLLKREFSGE